MTNPETKYRVEAGGVARRVFGARRQIEREGHTLAVQQLTDIPATVPEGAQHWAYEVRRGRMTVYGGVLRFLDLLHRRGASLETALMIPRWIEAYIRELWADRPNESAVPLRKVG